MTRYLPHTEDLAAPKPPGRKKVKRDQTPPLEVELHGQVTRLLLARAQERAEQILAAQSRLTVDLKWSAVPVFHLDADDPVRLETPEGAVTVRFSEGSIPLGVGDEVGMTGGYIRTVYRRRLAPRKTSPRE